MSADVANGPELATMFRPNRRAPHATGMMLKLAVMAGCLALLFDFSGAFDTDEIEPLRRSVLWLLISVLQVAQTSLIDSALVRLAPPGRLYRVLTFGGTVGAVIVLMTIELQALKQTSLTPAHWRHEFLDLAMFIAPTVAVITGLVVLLRNPFVSRTIFSEAVQHYPWAPRLQALGRLDAPRLLPAPDVAVMDPAWPEEPVLWVRAYDHYLEVATGKQTVFFRGRMRDAVMRLKSAPGLQVHRSWWVAKEAVASVQREGRDHTLLLRDGARAPVGRSRTDMLRTHGWL